MEISDNGFARRCRLDLNTPIELAIRNIICQIEAFGCDPLLTEASVLVQQAFNKVADFIEQDK